MTMKAYTVGMMTLALSGCQTVETAQMTGTRLVETEKGRQEVATFVTPEEYERMTPAERERVNASIGVEATVARWGAKPAQSPERVSEKDLDEAMSGAK